MVTLCNQDKGMAMKSPLSPIFANIFIEESKQRAIASAVFSPNVCFWYVDDTFVISAGVMGKKNYVISENTSTTYPQL